MFDNYKNTLEQAGVNDRWFINLKEEIPIKVALVGDYVTGKIKWIGNKKFAATSDDKDADFVFAINAWDGKLCRKLEHQSCLFRSLGELHESTSGLQNIWVEIYKEGNMYAAKYAGDLSESDKQDALNAKRVDLNEKCNWAEQF